MARNLAIFFVFNTFHTPYKYCISPLILPGQVYFIYSKPSLLYWPILHALHHSFWKKYYPWHFHMHNPAGSDRRFVKETIIMNS